MIFYSFHSPNSYLYFSIFLLQSSTALNRCYYLFDIRVNNQSVNLHLSLVIANSIFCYFVVAKSVQFHFSKLILKAVVIYLMGTVEINYSLVEEG